MQSLKRRWKWFSADLVDTCIPVQDTIHIGAKCRTRFLKKEKPLISGSFIASSSDIEYLLSLTQHVSKEQHLLKESDLNLTDKMNYGAVERLCNEDIRKLLQIRVPSRLYLLCNNFKK